MIPKSKPSGQHPAVKEYRRKMQSIQDGVLSDLEDLDRKIMHEVDSLPPPPMPEST